jgi:hypothetical protein
MPHAYVASLQSEWLKKKGSLASWMVVTGAFFTPAIIVVARLVYYERLPALYASDEFWILLWKSAWESMAIFLLPLGVILATSLTAQLEYKNNTWKQLHTTPLPLTVIFLSKLTVIAVMMMQFLVLFNIGIWLAGVVPQMIIPGVSWPGPIPYAYFLREDLLYFVDCLPIIALQYLLSLHYRNFLVSIGCGFIFWIAALGALSWKYGFVFPYTYGMFNYLKAGVETKAAVPPVNIHGMALGYFLLFAVAGYYLYITKKEKG